MRISELLAESEILDEITRPSEYDAEKILFKAGYKKLGSGSFANVFGKTGADHILKLFGADDKAYLEFVKLVNSNPDIHFPRFKGKMMRVTAGYYAIRMEWLTPVPDNNETTAIAKTLSNYTRLVRGEELYKQTIQDVNNAMWELEEEQPGITKTCQLIAHGTTRLIDIHNENYMMRGDVLVITDPVAW